jgi:energy-coupling factor transporter ATP-binding protein EcfA2
MADEAALLKSVHKALINFDKRAERASDSILAATFVDSEPLYDLLSTRNNQVIYGRRGTGKTHALKYLAEQVHNEKNGAVYVDLRSVGSNGSIYADESRPLAERASTLIIDVLSALFDELQTAAIERIDDVPDAAQVTARIDDLRSAISAVRIIGEVEVTAKEVDTTKKGGEGQLSLNLTSVLTGSGGLKAKVARSSEALTGTERRAAGEERIHLDFGNISGSVRSLIQVLGFERLWLLIDEWSEIPIALQPYLADLFRRTLLPVPEVTVKIAAIEHRSDFSILRERGEYIGIELGADVAADLNLDHYMVFDNNQDKATEFFKNLLFKHYEHAEGAASDIDSPDALVGVLFTQITAFQEFVRAVEGVPRDALNLAAVVSTSAYGKRVSVSDVRAAARDWYQQDKAAVIRNNPELHRVLNFVIDEVIGNRRARAFLFPSNSRDVLIEKLFDARLLHLLKRNISAQDEPGARYDVYKVDYGCYVELITTTKAPMTLFYANDDEIVEVPRDDYRSIRRAILRPEELAAAADSAAS